MVSQTASARVLSEKGAMTLRENGA